MHKQLRWIWGINPRSKKEVDLNVKFIKVYGDSKNIVKQVRNTIHCVSNHLKNYQQLVLDSLPHFTSFEIKYVPRAHNSDTNLLANVASKLIPSEEFSHERFSIELLFRPYVPNNITNWRVFSDDEHIISFLTQEDTYKYLIIDENQQDSKINSLDCKAKPENIVPKSIVKLENFYDLQDRFKTPTKCKKKSSTMKFEIINLELKKIHKILTLD